MWVGMKGVCHERRRKGSDAGDGVSRDGGHLRARTKRGYGWTEILQRLGDVEAGIAPTLFIHQRCGRLIEMLPALQHDPNRPEDVLKVDADEDSVGGDDAADAPRHWVATKSRAATARKLRRL
jgi:hypothetical protein